MGGGDDAHVDLDLAAAADALHRALLEHAQQLHLHVGRHVADLVEEQGAAIGLLELALVLGVGAGERALFVAEQLGFEQFARDRAAIDRDERLAGAAALGVDGAGDDFLAAAARAGQQHRGVARRDLADEAPEARHRGRIADNHAFKVGADQAGDSRHG